MLCSTSHWLSSLHLQKRFHIKSFLNLQTNFIYSCSSPLFYFFCINTCIQSKVSTKCVVFLTESVKKKHSIFKARYSAQIIYISCFFFSLLMSANASLVEINSSTRAIVRCIRFFKLKLLLFFFILMLLMAARHHAGEASVGPNGLLLWPFCVSISLLQNLAQSLPGAAYSICDLTVCTFAQWGCRGPWTAAQVMTLICFNINRWFCSKALSHHHI